MENLTKYLNCENSYIKKSWFWCCCDFSAQGSLVNLNAFLIMDKCTRNKNVLNYLIFVLNILRIKKSFTNFVAEKRIFLFSKCEIYLANRYWTFQYIDLVEVTIYVFETVMFVSTTSPHPPPHSPSPEEKMF